MPIKAKRYVSIRCDMCKRGHDEIDITPKEAMEMLKLCGWTGTYKKCFCPVCSLSKSKDVK